MLRTLLGGVVFEERAQGRQAPRLDFHVLNAACVPNQQPTMFSLM